MSTILSFEGEKTGNKKKGALFEVLAKVMAVSAGQKRLQMDEALNSYNISFDDEMNTE